MPSSYTEARSALANSAAILATPRNVARYLGYAAMGTLVELVWRSQVRSGDLTAALTDHFVGDGTTVVDIGASWGLFSYHLARLVGGAGTVFSYEPHPMNKPVLEKLVNARPNVHFRPVGRVGPDWPRGPAGSYFRQPACHRAVKPRPWLRRTARRPC